jgi:hypothetical protein
VDPARNVARRASRDGIQTLPQFFSTKLARQIATKYGKAKVIAANNVFAHINDLDDIVHGVSELLTKDGVFVIEAPYNVDLIEKNLFDIIYHEHLSYLSVRPLDRYFKSFGLRIFDVVKTPVHGGSIRMYVQFNEGPYSVEPSVQNFIDNEREKGLSDISTYKKFALSIEANKKNLTTILRRLKEEKKSIAGYGAPAKSTTLLHYFNIGPETIDFIADDSVFKQGLYTPGKHIPVVAPDEIYTKKPDYLLLLAWNFSDSIIKIHNKYARQGGKFIVPVPTPLII